MADDGDEFSLDTYEFPTQRLRRRIQSSDRTPLVLIACGSFSPITFLHLRMFEMAADYARFNTNFEVVGAYLSCVGDAYKKTGLVKAEHRINMCNLAVAQSSWISVDPWEALHSEYLETAKVSDHFSEEINETLGGVETPVGKKKCTIALLAGADLIQTMSTPGVWAQADIDYILRNFGAFIVEVCSDARDISNIPTYADLYDSAQVQTSMKHFQRYNPGRTISGSFNNSSRTTFPARRSGCSAVETCLSDTLCRSQLYHTSRPITCTMRMARPAREAAARKASRGQSSLACRLDHDYRARAHWETRGMLLDMICFDS